MQYAETQTSTNSKFVPTNLTLLDCWRSDEQSMVDWNLYRDNATDAELLTIESEATQDAITARVMARGWYTRDGKVTRNET
jgi:hypothetical protein